MAKTFGDLIMFLKSKKSFSQVLTADFELTFENNLLNETEKQPFFMFSGLCLLLKRVKSLR